jgi:hypothetical protein
MSDHGFGKTQTGSPISQADVEETARQISDKRYIVRAFVVRYDGKKCPANIVFQFDHISNYGMTHAQMIADIEAINVNGHRPHDTDIYIVLKEYAHGKYKK